MPAPDSSPKLPKLPFLAADAFLLAAAAFIAARAPAPLSPGTIYAIVAAVAAAGAAGMIPFLVEYARRQDEALDERQRGLEALAGTIAASAEQIGIGAQGLHEIAELGRKNLRDADELPARVRDREDRLQKLAERIEAAADRAAKQAAAAKLEAAAERKLAAARAEPKPAPPAVAPAEQAPESPPPPAAAPDPAPPPPAPAELPAPPARADAEPPIPLPDPSPAPAPAAEPPLPPKPRRAARPPAPPPEPKPEAEQGEFSQLAPEEAAPPAAVSADGATRLIVTAYIGIGNRLFVRGEGPGLRWDRGVPLQFVSIGKWRWETPDAAAPVRYKLFKNDDTECAALGERVIEPGRQQEITAAF
jgi:hypothetical protein